MRGQFYPRTKDSVDKANQLLDDFSNMLERGIKLIDQLQLILIKKHQHQTGSRNDVWLYASRDVLPQLEMKF